MALNTSVQPFIQKMLMPADAEGAGESLVGAFRNFAGAYVAAKEGQRAEQARKSTNPQSYDEAVDGASNPPDRPGRFESFAKAYLGAQGQVAMGANPALRPQVELLNQRVREGLLEERTLNQITSQDPMRVAEEAGNLTPSQVPQWLQKNAALRAVPWGQKIWDGVAAAYGDSEQAKISSAKAQIVGKLSVKYPNLDYSNPADRARMMRNESVEELYARAAKQGKLLNALPDDWFFDDGTINDQKAVPGLGALPRSETLQSLEERVEDRIKAAGQPGSYAPSMFERDIQSIEKRLGRALSADEFKGYADIHMGTSAKASAAGQFVDRAVLKSKLDRRKELQKQMDDLRGSGSAAGVADMKQIRQAIQTIDRDIEEMGDSNSAAQSNPRLEPLEGGKLRYVPK